MVLQIFQQSLAEPLSIALKNQLVITRSHGLSECHCETSLSRGTFQGVSLCKINFAYPLRYL